MRPIPEITYDFLRKHELLVLRVYDDARPKAVLKPGDAVIGTLTGGYGHTGADVVIGLDVDKALAERWLREDLAEAATRLWRKIGAVVEALTEHQYAALLSFVFNLGVDGGMANATIWKRLNARQFDQVPLEMMKFDKARVGPIDPKTKKRALKKLPGLVRRRADEVVLWSTAEPGTSDLRLTSATLRELETPATPADPTPARRSATLWAAVCAGVAGALKWLGDLVAQVPEFANTALAAINPFAAKSEWAQAVVNGVGGLAAVAGLFVAVQVVRKKNEGRR